MWGFWRLLSEQITLSGCKGGDGPCQLALVLLPLLVEGSGGREWTRRDRQQALELSFSCRNLLAMEHRRTVHLHDRGILGRQDGVLDDDTAKVHPCRCCWSTARRAASSFLFSLLNVV